MDTIIYTLQGSFVADSAFRYLTIGNFMKDEDTQIETQPALVKRCQFQGYVFWDSVCIMTSGPDLIPKDVSFKTNSSELTAKAKSVLTAFANDVGVCSFSFVIYELLVLKFKPKITFLCSVCNRPCSIKLKSCKSRSNFINFTKY